MIMREMTPEWYRSCVNLAFLVLYFLPNHRFLINAPSVSTSSRRVVFMDILVAEDSSTCRHLKRTGPLAVWPVFYQTKNMFWVT